MRLVAKEYEDGDSYALETSNDGREITRTLKGSRKPMLHVPVFIELVCDDTPEAIDKLHETLLWLMEEVNKIKDHRTSKGQMQNQ